jgi:nucleoid-associated protein YgaU
MTLADAGRGEDPLLSKGFVPVANGAHDSAASAQTVTQTPPTPAAPKSFEYKAMAGDTVSKMARKYYGLDTKGNRDLIVAANKSLKGDPNKIEVGKTYIIPVKPGSVSAAQAAAAPVAAAVSAPLVSQPTAVQTPAQVTTPTTPATPPTAAPASDSAERSYTVRQGDNLWKIAKEQCGDVNSLDQLKKLNADVLKNGIDLKVGTKLKLPAKKEQ